ncbi:hypothetical protein [Nitrosomonas communis]|uniref:hypothetical protein n=1 Tax=Nitrosomonas communis TaxID=44574 RepID=UPI0015A709C4|nr:hypothetical protein [Nitrosomonas communis]
MIPPRRNIHGKKGLRGRSRVTDSSAGSAMTPPQALCGSVAYDPQRRALCLA